MKRTFLLFMTATFAIFSITAQVGINTENIHPSAALQIESPLNNQGVLLPSLTSGEINAINLPADGLTVWNEDIQCFQYYQAVNKEWIDLCGARTAQISTHCDSIFVTVNGVYTEAEPLNASNTLTLRVYFKKTGNYTLAATVKKHNGDSNGYTFSAVGVNAQTGWQDIELAGTGTPAFASGITGGNDSIHIISIQGTEVVCPAFPVVFVDKILSQYAIDCSSLTVNNAVYKKGIPLNPSTHTITVRVTVSSAGSYAISTDKVSGIQFSASGEFSSAGSYSVTLAGRGTPTVNTDISLHITTNTEQGNANCSVTVPITLLAMKYAIIGSGDYSWAQAARTAALTNGASFGANGMVKIENFSPSWSTSNVTVARENLTNNLNNINGNTPDIILYYAYGAEADAGLITKLADYVNRGGVLIYAPASGSDINATRNLLNKIFGSNLGAAFFTSSDATNGVQYDNTYPINNLPADPIINGPFGHLSGRFWSEENEQWGTAYVTVLPANSVQICSAYNPYGHASTNPDWSVVWYNEKKNFVYFGDSTGSSTGYQTSTDDFAATYTSAGLPFAKPFGNWGMTGNRAIPYCYDAALELNAVAWAIKKAAVAGIKPY